MTAYGTAMHLLRQLKNVYHFCQAHWWRAWYGFPDRGLRLVGVTGTNGKTTTCYVVASMLAAQFGRERVGMLTTVAWRIGAREEVNATKLTTLPSRLVYRHLRGMREAGVTYGVLELTSHALDQNRVAGILLTGAIILNIEREHLDYHGTMAAYAAAKAKIVGYLKPGAPLVAKGDDTFVQSAIQLRITDYPPSLKLRGASGLRITPTWFTSAQARTVSTPLPGEVNRENVLAAGLLARALGVSDRAVREGVAVVTHVPGRMEWMELPGGVRALIDYAVTPGALERLYREAHQQKRGRIFAVLGAAGNRDRGKRPPMAAAVARYADELVLTREDPWTELEEQIFRDLEQGLVGMRTVWRRIVDRREAIRYCLMQARAGDVVVVTGKGAETGMGIGKKIVPWNDRQVIEELAESLYGEPSVVRS